MSLENTSGQGRSAIVPPEIDRWNWGAFLLNWIWGLGNHTFIALLALVPVVNLAVVFILGAKGSTWAWRNKRWASVQAFQHAQRRWTRAALIVYALLVAGFIAFYFFVGSWLRDSEPYRLSQALLSQNPDVVALVGEPMRTGLPSGGFQLSGPNGRASFQYGVEGPKGSGTAYVEATRELGRWRIDRMAFDTATGRRIDLISSGRPVDRSL